MPKGLNLKAWKARRPQRPRAERGSWDGAVSPSRISGRVFLHFKNVFSTVIYLIYESFN